MNTYIAYYNGRQLEVTAGTSYEAQQKAALLFRVGRRTWLVTVMLAKKDDETVVHHPAEL